MSSHSINHRSTCEEIDQYITNLTKAICKTVEDHVPTKEIDIKKPGLPQNIRDKIKEKKQRGKTKKK